MRTDGRNPDQMREVKISRNIQQYAAGSVLIEFGNSKVICAASIDNKVPPFLRYSKSGWLTAEYSLLPGATPERTIRDSSRGRISGRSHEIQRLIGRSLRSVINLKALGERTIWIDCDVLQADGGTRTAAITGAWLAMFEACLNLDRNEHGFAVKDYLAAISVGLVDDQVLLDLDYAEDSRASVDLNLVLTGSSKIVEIQGTAEGEPYDFKMLDRLLALAKTGIDYLITLQQDFAGDYFKKQIKSVGLG
ncbi:ribonuclease PH [bacterium]|nr:ribonuclease PH [bacterium]